jgi:NitT/TauT family transport system permease protein
MSIFRKIGPPVITGMFFIGAWYGFILWTNAPGWKFPFLHEVLVAGYRERVLLFEGALETLSGAFLGFTAAVGLGFCFSVMMAASVSFRRAFYPYILALQMIPVIVLAPVCVLYFGTNLLSVTAIAFLISFFPIVANTTQGLISTDQNLIDLFKMCNASRFQEVTLLRVPYALPHFLTGMRISATLAPIGAIAGEFYAGSAGGAGGLGFLAIVYNARSQVAELYATGFIACLCGFLFVSVVIMLNWWLLHKWHDSIERKDL